MTASAITEDPVPPAQLCFRKRKGVISFALASESKVPTSWRCLPDLPASLVDYLVVACERFWLRHQCPIGFLLLLNPTTFHWTCEVPQQICGRRSCQFLRYQTLPPGNTPAGYLLAGSLQSFIHDPQDHLSPVPSVPRFPPIPSASPLHPMPTFPGLHFTCVAPDFSQTLAVHLACNAHQNDCQELNLDTVIIDDHRAIIEAAGSRLTFLHE